jgi:outer membrane protein
MQTIHSFFKKTFLTAAISLGLLSHAYAAGSSIGAINLNYILANAKIAQNSSQRVEKEYLSKTEPLKSLAVKLDTLSEKLANGQKNKTTETAEFKKNEEEFLKLREEFQQKEKAISDSFTAFKTAEDKKVLQEIDAVIKTVANQEKVDVLVVSPIYANSKADMTMKVLDILNK